MRARPTQASPHAYVRNAAKRTLLSPGIGAASFGNPTSSDPGDLSVGSEDNAGARRPEIGGRSGDTQIVPNPGCTAAAEARRRGAGETERKTDTGKVEARAGIQQMCRINGLERGATAPTLIASQRFSGCVSHPQSVVSDGRRGR